LAAREIRISMDGKGAWRDNVFVERLWLTFKYEEVYLRAYASVSEARAGSAATSDSTTAAAPIRCLTGKPPIRPTSTRRRHTRRRHNPNGKPLRKRRILFRETEPPLWDNGAREFHAALKAKLRL
jgi:putative transposase